MQVTKAESSTSSEGSPWQIDIWVLSRLNKNLIGGEHERLSARSRRAHYSLSGSAVLCILLLVAACSYNGPLRSAQMQGAPVATARQGKITLSASSGRISDYRLSVGAVTLSYEIKEPLRQATKQMLESIYDQVEIGEELAEGSSGFVVPYFRATTLASGGTTASFETVLQIDIYDRPGGRLLRTYQATRKAYYSNPPAATALGALTGLTLLVLSPITIPIALDIEGDHGREHRLP